MPATRSWLALALLLRFSRRGSADDVAFSIERLETNDAPLSRFDFDRASDPTGVLSLKRGPTAVTVADDGYASAARATRFANMTGAASRGAVLRLSKNSSEPFTSLDGAYLTVADEDERLNPSVVEWAAYIGPIDPDDTNSTTEFFNAAHVRLGMGATYTSTIADV